jgi:translation initiation factor 3 subunit F
MGQMSRLLDGESDGDAEIGVKLMIRYATHPDINGYSALIQNYFTAETAPFPAVHLTVDTVIKEDGSGLGVKGWISQQIGLQLKAENCVFLPIPVQIKYASSERAARMSN